jgi:transposase-like protein
MYYELRQIAKRYDMREIIKADGSKKVVLCPFPFHLHASFTPSFSVFHDADGRQKFKCHGCGATCPARRGSRAMSTSAKADDDTDKRYALAEYLRRGDSSAAR